MACGLQALPEVYENLQATNFGDGDNNEIRADLTLLALQGNAPSDSIAIPARNALQRELNVGYRSGYLGTAIAEATTKLRPMISNMIFFFITCSFLRF